MNKIKLLLLFIVFALLFVGCANAGNKDENNDGIDIGSSSEERIIIYKTRINITVDDHEETYKTIKDMLSSDEWFDKVNIYETSISLVIRVKSTRLDDFLSQLRELGEVDFFEKEATDISLSYYDKQNRLRALEAELDRLLALYEEASFQEMLIINNRISEVNTEIDKLKSDINYYENLVEYSTITLNLYGKYKKNSFGKEISEAFSSGVELLVDIFEAFVILISFLAPISIILIPVAVLIFILTKKRKKKRQLLNQQLLDKINSRAD